MTFPVSGGAAPESSEAAAASEGGDTSSFEASSDDSVDWGELGDSLDSFGDGTPVVDAAEDTGEQPATPAPEAQQTPAVEPQQAPAPEQPAQQPEQQQQAQQTQPQEQAQAQAQETPPQQQEQTQPQQMTAEQYQQQVQQVEQQWAEQLSQSYALSEEDAVALQENPAEALPKFAARLHMQVTREVFQNLQQNLPNWVNSITEQTQGARKSEDEFFEAWPELKGHEQLITQAGSIWRQMNPNGSKEDFIKAVGAMAWQQAGLPLDKLLSRQSGGQRPGQQGEVMGTVQTPAQQQQHPSPATSHAAAAPQHAGVSPQGEESYWAGFAESFDQF